MFKQLLLWHDVSVQSRGTLRCGAYLAILANAKVYVLSVVPRSFNDAQMIVTRGTSIYISKEVIVAPQAVVGVANRRRRQSMRSSKVQIGVIDQSSSRVCRAAI